MSVRLGLYGKTVFIRLFAAIWMAAWTLNAWSITPAVDVEHVPLNTQGCCPVAGISLSREKMIEGDTFLYLAGFNPGLWSGSLKKFSIATGADGIPQITLPALWDAAEVLTGNGANSPRPAPEQRKIFIGRPDSGNAWTTVEFLWESLSGDQRKMLNASPASGGYAPTGLQHLEYLRGVRSMEAGQVQGFFRKRASLLGDIIGSKPVYVGAPAWRYSGLDYQAFHEARKGRRKAVYVGANDGMLHAFDAADGTELFAYIPNALLPALSQLTRIDYQHRPYVDGGISVSEAEVLGNWKTVLAAGVGGGAQGVFALDVSDPEHFSEGKGALWEFTDGDDADLGNIMGAPLIAKFKTGDNKGVPVYKYFVVIANGVNSYKEDGANRFSHDAAGALFLLSLDKSPGEKWRQGVNYFKFKTPITEIALPNGLMAPAMAVGDDGAARVIYAGDLQGNLWRFDFSGVKPWSGASPGNNPVFVAMDDRQRRQPISARPAIAFAPGGGYVVLFGTGKFLESGDGVAANFSMQSLYGIYDTLKKDYRIAGRSELALRTMAATTGNAMQIGGNAFDYDATTLARKGWYVDFPDSDRTGERSVTDPVLASGRLFFQSLLPGASFPENGRRYVLDALSGLAADSGVTGHVAGMNQPLALLDIGSEAGSGNGAGNRRIRKRHVILKFPNAGSGDPGNAIAMPSQAPGLYKITSPAGRFSWREMINWQELGAVATKKKGKT